MVQGDRAERVIEEGIAETIQRGAGKAGRILDPSGENRNDFIKQQVL
jgi:hypothetical protein